ncbi:S-adenosyl-L-methionine-dependent methyltransferase [Cucurbitaria berberidis CBS 394.84]|uniref:S-adenosyl-L-methionine-dependent methyltransferase n=1 Tax=Cucurbitaria berberidis CBS 394.84 TaxID=1168544 RepID=A0A9P4L612_9PLEO|nr:S-adenosyl-L-methionine-dependent methyltransferase [Cucurbitaria berberidis CBS 394.84]KAF1842824.1 S-adenosyl-L-methionine-dependent methyltransferase [Cucurbitaria berberidis CBS 394.84]
MISRAPLRISQPLSWARNTVTNALYHTMTCTSQQVQRQRLPYKHQNRSISTTPRRTMAAPTTKDWSATQYLKFNNERTRAVYDLVAQVTPHISTSTPRIYDLGCGPGNSTQVLRDAFPGAKLTGMDSSPDMLEKARSALPDVEFVTGDLATFESGQEPDLLFSNAVFHWLRHTSRIPTLTRLFASLRPGGVVAIQVPDNYHEASHALMRDTALLPDSAWSSSFSDTRIGDVGDRDRPDLDPIEPPEEFYNALIPLAGSVNVWRTNYFHVLKDAGAIVEWVKGTGLQPYLNRIDGEEAKSAFLGEYERRLKRAYLQLVDGKVLLGYPRLFVVAVRK